MGSRQGGNYQIGSVCMAQLIHTSKFTAVSCRVKQYHSRSAQYEQILKKNEQMYALTAITLALCPAAQRELDETVMNTLKDKCAPYPRLLPSPATRMQAKASSHTDRTCTGCRSRTFPLSGTVQQA